MKILLISMGLTGLLGGIWALAPRKAPAVTVQVVNAATGDLKAAVTATGSLQPRRSVDIKFDGQNFVEHLDVSEGDAVTKDQVVARMDTRLLVHSRSQAQQVIEKDEASLALASAALKREQALWDANIVARAELETVEANYQGAVHQKEADHQALLEIEEQIDRSNLRSPVDGVVTQLFVREGEMLGSAAAVASMGASSATSKPTNTVMTLAQNGALQMYADVNEADTGGIYVGQNVEMLVDAFRPTVFHGRVALISLQPTTNNGITTYRVIVDLSDPSPKLRIGLPANVMFVKVLARHSVLLPVSALFREGDDTIVAVLERNNAKPQDLDSVKSQVRKVRVSVLARTQTAVAVKGPLQAADLIVLNGSDLNEIAGTQDLAIQKVEFRPNPTFSDLEFSGRKQGGSGRPA